MAENKKIAFLFGAGAEVDYGFPLGSRLAVELLSSKKVSEQIKNHMKNMDCPLTRNACITSSDLKILNKSIIENKRDEVKNFFEELESNSKSDETITVNDKSIQIGRLLQWSNSKNKEENKIATNMIKILAGVYGNELLESVNKSFFSYRDISLLDSEIFKLDYTKLDFFSSETLEFLNNESESDDSAQVKYKQLISTIIDYQLLLNNLYPDILDPKSSKFKKIAVILFKIQEIINSYYEKVSENCSLQSYYQDLHDEKILLEDAILSTTNYTNLIQDITGKDEIYFLNGNINQYFFIEELSVGQQGEGCYIPSIFTQTTLKPLFCVDMMEPFVQFSQEINSEYCDVLCIVGYAGNKDDVIVNSIIRKFLQKGKTVLYFSYCDDLKKDIKNECKRITNLYGESEKLKVVSINGKRMILSGSKEIFWLDYIKTEFGGIR